MVKNVEDLETELQVPLLVELKVLIDGHVEIEPTWITHEIATGIAVGQPLRRHKRPRISQ